MVQTKACRPCGTHKFSENVAHIGIAYLKFAKKGAQKYKKYDTKFMLCTPWEISPYACPLVYVSDAQCELLAAFLSNQHEKYVKITFM